MIVAAVIFTYFLIYCIKTAIHPETYEFPDEEEIFEGRTFHSELFDCDIKIYAYDVSDEYIDRCIARVDKITDEEKDIIIEDAVEWMTDMLGLVKRDELPEVISREDITRYIHPKKIYINGIDGEEPDEIEFLIEIDTDWCEGLEIGVLNNKVAGVKVLTGDLKMWR